MPFKDLRNQRQQIRTHHLGAGGPCIDMAVGTTLVAAVAEVDLPASEPVCTDAVTGLKFDHQFRRSGMLATTR